MHDIGTYSHHFALAIDGHVSTSSSKAHRKDSRWRLLQYHEHTSSPFTPSFSVCSNRAQQEQQQASISLIIRGTELQHCRVTPVPSFLS
jgi:hypothetical protein